MSSIQPDLPFARHRDFPRSPALALVLIDFQRAFVDPHSPTALDDAPGALRRAQQLFRSFVAADLPVVITRHAHRRVPAPGGMGSWWTRYLIDGDPGADLAAGLEPLGRAWVLRKEHYSAFRRTRLESWLRSRGVTDLVLAGVMTHICVDTTARDAFMRGFNVVVVYDACASKDALLHAASLTSLSHAVARVCATRQVTAALAKVKS